MRQDYDLNIYRQEVEVDGEYQYQDPWFIDIYLCTYINDSGGCSTEQVGSQIELAPEESAKLQLGSGYFDEDDCWYGFDGFVKDYEHQISDRLWDIFNALPRLNNDKEN